LRLLQQGRPSARTAPARAGQPSHGVVLISNGDEDVSNSRRLQQSELLVKQGLAIDIGQALWTIADRALQSASTTGCENYRLPNAVGVAAGSA